MENRRAETLAVLERYWGYSSFRPLQQEIIMSILHGHDTLGLLPTGGGKSLTFQVPAMMADGLTIVVTPLISLMKDQVDNLRATGINAVFTHSGLSRREQKLVLDKCRLNKAKLLYISPEKLRSPQFISEMRDWDVSLIVVDEAHCISQWGYDFRPSYLQISELRKAFPSVPVLALTASATPDVVEDIRRQLQFRDGHMTYSRSFSRDNLSYIVRYGDDKPQTLLRVLKNTSGSAIVYVRSRRRTRELAQVIQQAGITAEFYHAGLSPEDKNERQNRWKDNSIRVIVATNAFGMGIDKPDVRTVVHYDLPSSLEEYYQEAGRGGRDGKPSYAVVLACNRDKALLSRRLSDSFPPKEYITDIYDKLGVFLDIAVGSGYNQVYEFDFGLFCQRYSLQPAPARSALTILSQSGYIDYTDEISTYSRVMLTARKEELYNLPIDGTTDMVFQMLLRSYTGLFADYVYIDEKLPAYRLQLHENDIYQSLLALGRMHVLHYIPRKTTPYVAFTTSRELPKYVTIPRQVYEQRRDVMESRIDAMKKFTFDTSQCRVSTLLEYFGENPEGGCGQCDVCRGKKRVRPSATDKKAIEASIAYLCSHPGGVTMEHIIANANGNRKDISDAVRRMLDEEIISMSSTAEGIRLKKL